MEVGIPQWLGLSPGSRPPACPLSCCQLVTQNEGYGIGKEEHYDN